MLLSVIGCALMISEAIDFGGDSRPESTVAFVSGEKLPWAGRATTTRTSYLGAKQPAVVTSAPHMGPMTL